MRERRSKWEGYCAYRRWNLALWDGADPPLDEVSAHQNNLAAADFIREEMDAHSVFILTAPSITGWPHKNVDHRLDS